MLSVVDSKTDNALHDFINKISLAANWFTQIDLWETQIQTSDPTPKPRPQEPKPQDPQQPKPEPKPQVVAMKSKLPTGKQKVAEYKAWLMQQLSMVNRMKGDEIIDFDK